MNSDRTDRSYLSFQLLEDVMDMPPLERKRLIGASIIRRLGPLVEYAYHNYNAVISSLHLFGETSQTRELKRGLSLSSLSTASQNSSLRAQEVEFFRTPQTALEADDFRWDAFRRRFQNAAQSAGFSLSYAQALTGTFGEMVDNAFQHSDYAETGIAGYRWQPNEFEYVVADNGIGVLHSFRKHPHYKGLVDAHQALQTALLEGESCRGRGTGHGFGFHELVKNIANNNSFLRFRSGNHSLVINGVNQSPERVIRACAEFQGFLISVVCIIPKP